MSTQSDLLNLLESRRGSFFSGAQIAESLGVSRTAVWKAVNALKDRGYPITSITNKGYCLASDTDVLSTANIQKYLLKDYSNFDIETFESIDSTNTYLKEKAGNGAKEGTIAVAGEQLSGRGRRGRDFYSPKGTGVYFSILLRPVEFEATKAGDITTIAAVAVCEAIEKVAKKTAGIKWVNDIFVDKKKVCGILTEASFDMESQTIEYAVLGIGINLYSPAGGFPKEISSIAASVSDDTIPDGKSLIVAETLNSFFKYYFAKNHGDFRSEYKNRSIVIGKEIEVISVEKKKPAKAVDIDDDCHLIVEYKDGKNEVLSSGEISIKLK